MAGRIGVGGKMGVYTAIGGKERARWSWPRPRHAFHDDWLILFFGRTSNDAPHIQTATDHERKIVKLSCRRSALFVVGSASVVLLAASTSFACLVAKGSITVTGATAGSTVTGANGQMTFCSNPPTAATVTKGNNITVAVAPAPACSGANVALPDGTYEVRLQDNTASTSWVYDTVSSTWKFQANTGCWKVTSKTLTTSYVVSGGSNAGTSMTVPTTANSSGINKAAGVCVGDGTNGMFAPLHVN